MEEIHVTGTEISYLYICPRKLWLFRHGIKMENENTHVQLGKLIQEETFSRHPKEIPLGDIGVIDWAELPKGIIHETKKGKCPKDGEIAQTRYYLWWLRKHNVDVRHCIIHYPKIRKTQKLDWEDGMEMSVKRDLEAVVKIIKKRTPPDFVKLPWCKSCAYEEYCSI
jgi:CRISPR-associated exonuclease Cas4